MLSQRDQVRAQMGKSLFLYAGLRYPDTQGGRNIEGLAADEEAVMSQRELFRAHLAQIVKPLPFISPASALRFTTFSLQRRICGPSRNS